MEHQQATVLLQPQVSDCFGGLVPEDSVGTVAGLGQFFGSFFPSPAALGLKIALGWAGRRSLAQCSQALANFKPVPAAAYSFRKRLQLLAVKDLRRVVNVQSLPYFHAGH
jgi:hypothetical protein